MEAHRETFWLNVDIPTRTATLHEFWCPHVFNYAGKKAPANGFWREFSSIDDARDAARIAMPGHTWKECGDCRR